LEGKKSGVKRTEGAALKGLSALTRRASRPQSVQIHPVNAEREDGTH